MFRILLSRGVLSKNVKRNGLSGHPIATQFASPTKLLSQRFYAISANKSQPRVRYLFYMFLFSSGVLYLAATRLLNKRPKTSFTEEEFAELNKSGLKRRNKLVSSNDNSKYSFFVIPYYHREAFVQKVCEKLGTREVKVIDPQKLIEEEVADETRHYSFLLQDLQATGKPMPKGLITALIKEEVRNYLNTRRGTFDTNFVIKNYPQTTDEAIKFENEISDVLKCLVLHFDILNKLEKDKGPEGARLINNVLGYFDAVGKTNNIVAKHDELDEKISDLALEII